MGGYRTILSGNDEIFSIVSKIFASEILPTALYTVWEISKTRLEILVSRRNRNCKFNL
jgi:hypothetical protein